MQKYGDTMSVQELILTTERYQTISSIIKLWLAGKEGTSRSKRTHETYTDYITTFRQELMSQGYDLDGLPLSTTISTPRYDVLVVISLAAQSWAQRAERCEQIGAAAYNQRLAVISSFYRFAKRRRLLIMDNPIDLIERKTIQEYAKAHPLEREDVASALKKIDRSTLAGKRDYALLLVFLNTGRRASEVLNLHWRDVRIVKEKVTLTFHCKGNLLMQDNLEPRASAALLDYLYCVFRLPIAEQEGEHPLWLSFAQNQPPRPLTLRGMAYIIKKHLGTNIHATRHTFAHGMEEAGAKVSEIQQKLGHKSVATTGRYLQRLSSAENKHATKLLDYLGVENE